MPVRADREEHRQPPRRKSRDSFSARDTRGHERSRIENIQDLRPPRARPATLTYTSVGEDVDSDVTFDHSYDALRYLLNRKSSRARMVGIAAL
jgi:hypothetical protein